MAISYVGVGTINSSSGATSRTLSNSPTVSNGDWKIAICGVKNADSHTWSGTGWTKVAQVSYSTTLTVSIGVCKVTGSEGNPTITWTNSAACGGRIFAYRGGTNASSPFSASNSNSGTGSTHSVTAFTSTRNNSMAIYAEFASANTALGTPSGWTENFDSGSATGSVRMVEGEKSISTSGSSSGNISVTGASADWVMFQFEILVALTSLLAGAGSFTATFNDATMLRGLKLMAGAGSFTATFDAAKMSRGYVMKAGTGSFGATFNDATMLRGLKLQAGAGSFAATFGDATMLRGLKLMAGAGSFAATFDNAAMLRGLKLLAGTGSFTATVEDATMLRGLRLLAGAGSFTATGEAAQMLRGLLLRAGAGSFAATFDDATMTYTPNSSAYILKAGTGSFTATFDDAAMLRGLLMKAGTGSFVTEFDAAKMLRGLMLKAGTGSFAATFNDATMTYTPFYGAYTLLAGTGVFTAVFDAASMQWTVFQPSVNGSDAMQLQAGMEAPRQVIGERVGTLQTGTDVQLRGERSVNL